MISAAYIPGWASGDWQDRRIKEAIGKSFTYTDKAKQADVIIAHSLGCFQLPKHQSAKLVAMIDPPYWPGKSILQSLAQNMGDERHKYLAGMHSALDLISHQLFYIFRAAIPTIQALRRRRDPDFSELNSLLVIRNRLDPFCSTRIKEIMPKDARYVELPGIHSDLYSRPATYIKLIKDTYDNLA